MHRCPSPCNGVAARVAAQPAPRLSAFQAGHNPSRHKMYVRLVLSPVADACRWSLLLLSPLLSITVGGTDAHDGWHLGALVLVATSGPFPGEVTSPCPAQTPPPNPIAAEPGDGRVLSSLKERGRVNGGFDGVLAAGGRA